MNSQVRTTLTIVIISSALVLGLVATTPASIDAGQAASARDGNAIVASIGGGAFSAEAPVLTGLTSTLQDGSTPPAEATSPRRKSGQSSRIRQSMAMPFFSFAPRG